MPRALALFLFPAFCFGLVHCVGDAPTDTSNDGGGGSDGAVDSATGGDGATNGDSSSESGGGGPVDACVGFTDCPKSVQAPNVMLWLRGNFGLGCISKRVSTWSDQSGQHDDATPVPHGLDTDALTPQCGVATVGGQEVATFTAPAETDAGDQTAFVDETLGVSLAWMPSSDYSFFVVHRRAADGTFTLIGNDGTSAGACSFMSGTRNGMSAFELGFDSQADGGNAYTVAHLCNTSITGDFLSAPSDTFASGVAELDEVVFASAAGLNIFVNGVNAGTDTSATAKNGLADDGLPGFVGRGYTAIGTDTRYRGDIAEIIGYNVALSDDDRQKIETYLKRQWALSF